MEALSDQLVVEDVRHALVETQALTSAHPPLHHDEWFQPIDTLCGLYLRFGFPLLLVAVTVESSEDLRRPLAAVGSRRARRGATGGRAGDDVPAHRRTRTGGLVWGSMKLLAASAPRGTAIAVSLAASR